MASKSKEKDLWFDHRSFFMKYRKYVAASRSALPPGERFFWIKSLTLISSHHLPVLKPCHWVFIDVFSFQIRFCNKKRTALFITKLPRRSANIFPRLHIGHPIYPSVTGNSFYKLSIANIMSKVNGKIIYFYNKLTPTGFSINKGFK